MPNRRPALAIIDMQVCMAWSEAGERNNLGAERNIEKLLAAWRSGSWPVVHVRHISRIPTSGFRPGQPGAAFQPAFEPLPHEHVVEKNVPCAFTNTGLERWLRTREIQELVVVGVSTNNSVEASVRTAGNLGFRVSVVADATFAFAKADYEGRQRTADEVHSMSLANMEGEYAAILAAADAVRLLADS